MGGSFLTATATAKKAPSLFCSHLSKHLPQNRIFCAASKAQFMDNVTLFGVVRVG
jgi:hypothetical protein